MGEGGGGSEKKYKEIKTSFEIKYATAVTNQNVPNDDQHPITSCSNDSWTFTSNSYYFRLTRTRTYHKLFVSKPNVFGECT